MFHEIGSKKMTSATSLKLTSNTPLHWSVLLRRRSSSSPLREAFRCSDCMRRAVGVLTFLPRFSFIFHSCIRREPCTFLPARRSPLRPQGMMRQRPMLLSSMLRSLQHQPQLRRPQVHFLRRFFVAAALPLAISTCTGLFMSWKYARHKAVVGGILLEGITCPLLLLFL